MSATSHFFTPMQEAKVVPIKAFEGHKDIVDCVAWYPDGHRIVSGSRDGELRIWDTSTGSQVGETIKGHPWEVWALDVSPDGTTIASGSGDRTIRLWHSETGELFHTCEGHEQRVREVHFSPDSKRLVSASHDQTLRIWDVQTGHLALEPVECDGAVYTVCYAADGDGVASGANNIQIWDVSDGSVSLVLAIEQLVTSLVWMHDGEHIVGGGLRQVIVWDVSSGEQIRTWKAHEDWIRLSLSPTTIQLATYISGGAHQTFVSNTDTGEKIGEYRHDTIVNHVAYSPSGKFVATACYDKRVDVWEAPQNSPSPGLSILDLPATTRPGDAEEYDQTVRQLPSTPMFDLPTISEPSPSAQPTYRQGRSRRRTVRGALDGVFRRRRESQHNDTCPRETYIHDQAEHSFERVVSHSRSSFFKYPRDLFASVPRRLNPPTDENTINQDGKTWEDEWVAESRTRPIYAFETGPLPDEVERGFLFHLASYICYGQRDPNAIVRSRKAAASASSSVPDKPSPIMEETIMCTGDLHTSATTTTPPIARAGTSPLIAKIRTLLDQLFAPLRSRLHPGDNVPCCKGHTKSI